MLLHFATQNHSKPRKTLHGMCIICPKNTSCSAQPTNKRLSSSRNSSPSPPPSLLITAFVAVHSTTHAFTSIRRHVRTDFCSLSCRITSPIESPRFWLGPIFLYPRASIADWLTFGAMPLACPNMVSKCAVRLDISRA